MITGSNTYTLQPWGQCTPAPAGSKVLIVATVAFTTTAADVNLAVDGIGGSSCQVILSQRNAFATIDPQDTILVCDGVIHYSANGNYITISRAGTSGYSGLQVDVLVIGSTTEVAITS